MNSIQRILKYILHPMMWIAFLLLTDSCKKSETTEPPVPPQTTPVFIVDHIFISVGGKDYIQFITRCSSETVKLDTARIIDPGNNRFYYEYYSDTTDYQIFCKDEPFTFPEDFLKQPGIWKFTFIGKRYKDNSDFTTMVNDTIVN